jgi:bis(5'-nucleosyl)-tetraphosphatase (symmetrical)
MRFLDAEGNLNFSYTGTVEAAPPNLYPWFLWPGRKMLNVELVFGHWAALMGICPYPELQAIDTGCVWGGKLTALRLQDKQRFSVEGALSRL